MTAQEILSLNWPLTVLLLVLCARLAWSLLGAVLNAAQKLPKGPYKNGICRALMDKEGQHVMER